MSDPTDSVKPTPSFVKRLGLAKLFGFIVGMLAFIFISLLWPDETLMFRIGFLFWYLTLGAVIGLFGVLDFHPALKLRMPFWVRGPWVGAWFNFVLVFLLHDKLLQPFALFGISLNPFWLVLEGAVVGLLIDWLATKFGGEGKVLL